MREPWQVQKAALKEKFRDGWNPRKRLSPDALAGIRAIHAQYPEQYTTSALAEKFEVSPEAIRRILKGRWTPREDEEPRRRERWFSRGQKIWSRYSELGLKPPARWRASAASAAKPTGDDRKGSVSDADAVGRPAGIALKHSPAASLAERIL
jgi:hypothetical protein